MVRLNPSLPTILKKDDNGTAARNSALQAVVNLMKLKKLGIFGGTFDPIHVGHLIEAQFATEELGLDKLLFVPTGDHPLKPQIASAEARLEMTRMAIEDNSSFELSDIEIKRSGKSYTIDTIHQV